MHMCCRLYYNRNSSTPRNSNICTKFRVIKHLQSCQLPTTKSTSIVKCHILTYILHRDFVLHANQGWSVK